MICFLFFFSFIDYLSVLNINFPRRVLNKKYIYKLETIIYPLFYNLENLNLNFSIRRKRKGIFSLLVSGILYFFTVLNNYIITFSIMEQVEIQVVRIVQET